MIIENTNRKFYNKWSYKISLFINGARYLHTWPSLNEHGYYQSAFFRSKIDLDTVISIQEFLETYNRSEWQKRTELNTLDIYTNNNDIFQKLAKKFEKHVVNLVQVDKKIAELESRYTPVIVKKLPHNRYKFKVFLKPHTFNKDINEKYSFLNFVDTQIPRIKMSQAVKNWFLSTNWNWDPRYIHVEDEGTLMLLKMRNPQALGRIHEHIIPDK